MRSKVRRAHGSCVRRLTGSQRCQKLPVETVKMDKTYLLQFLGVSKMHLIKGYFHIWDHFVSNGASLMHN